MSDTIREHKRLPLRMSAIRHVRSMRNNVPAWHCVSEAFILREIVLTMKTSVTLRVS